MNFALSEEQEQLRQIVNEFMTAKSPEAEVRRLMETESGYDEAVWQQMAEQMGLQALIIPEEFGGSGYSYVKTYRRSRRDGPPSPVRTVLLSLLSSRPTR